MYDDYEYIVFRINKGHRKGYPFHDYVEAVAKAVQVAEDCSKNEKFGKARVVVGLWDGEELDDEIDVTEMKDDFFYVLDHTDEFVNPMGLDCCISSGKYYNAAASDYPMDDGRRFPEDHVVFVEDNTVFDVGTDWKDYVIMILSNYGPDYAEEREVYQLLKP